MFKRRLVGWRHHPASNQEATNFKRNSQATYPKHLWDGCRIRYDTRYIRYPISVEPVSTGFLTPSIIGRLLSWQNIKILPLGHAGVVGASHRIAHQERSIGMRLP